MKKTMKTMLALMAGTLAFSACSDEDAILNENTGNATDATPILSFNAATESDGATRATIDALAINWQAGDAILMMDGTNNSKYNLDAECDGKTSGTFTVDGESTAVSGENIYALYPYSEGSSRTVTIEDAQATAGGSGYILYMLEHWKDDYERCDEYEKDEFFDMYHVSDELDSEGISEANKAIIYAYIKGEEVGSPAPALSGSSITNVVIPAVQTVAAGQTVDPKAVLMVAKADGDDLAFKNVCSYVKVTPTVACKKIEVRAMGADLAGACTVAVSDEPTASITSDGKSVVTLKAEAGDLAAGTYYIAVLPGAKSKGIEVRFYTGAETFNYNARSTSFTFVRSKVHSGGNNSGATGTIWSQNTDYRGWVFDYNPTEVKTVTISTGVSGAMPSGAKALNSDETLWSRKDAENNYFIETSASRIVATKMQDAFYYLRNVESYTGLDNLDVSEVSTFVNCFKENRFSLASLDLSSWQINPAASTSSMFENCMNLTSLTLNNSFHSGVNLIDRIGQYVYEATGNPCIIYGVTDEAVKNDLNQPGWTYNATYTHIKFDGE